MHFNDLVPIYQGAVTPVILISGVGLLLLSMTNRFARVVDRTRARVESMRSSPSSEHPRLLGQLEIMYGRARLLRLAIRLATLSVLTAAVMVITLFLTALLQVEIGRLGAALFIGCLLSLIASLILFLADINRSLAALKLECHSIDHRASF
jgi:hypothetical protein